MENIIEKLTSEQRTQIAREEYGKSPIETVGHVGVLKIAEAAISLNAKCGTLSTEATFNDKRYEIEAVVTYNEIPFDRK